MEEEQKRLKGEHTGAGFGNSIRSYVLHPYTLVKDARTGHETSNTQAVLDGSLDEFMRAYLQSQIGPTLCAIGPPCGTSRPRARFCDVRESLPAPC